MNATARDRHRANRAAWNEAAREYARELSETIVYLKGGGINLLPAERAELAPLEGTVRRAVHLQCASGQDTLSLWNWGAAEVEGVDISEVHVANARKVATALGAPARFHCADVLDTPRELDGAADLVYTGKGALLWLFDIDEWARVCARLLREGGHLYVLDGHPAEWLFDDAASEWRYAGTDYFHAGEETRGWSPQYLEGLSMGVDAQAVKSSRSWTLGEIVTAVARAGLRIESLVEHSAPYWDSFPHIPPSQQERVPRTFSLLARKETTR
jgi:SAM-dependent methyltransferase